MFFPDPPITLSNTAGVGLPTTPEELKVALEETKTKLKIEKRSTSKFQRSLSSTPDPRSSAAALGVVAGAIIGSIAIATTLIDVERYCRRKSDAYEMEESNEDPE